MEKKMEDMKKTEEKEIKRRITTRVSDSDLRLMRCYCIQRDISVQMLMEELIYRWKRENVMSEVADKM